MANAVIVYNRRRSAFMDMSRRREADSTRMADLAVIKEVAQINERVRPLSVRDCVVDQPKSTRWSHKGLEISSFSSSSSSSSSSCGRLFSRERKTLSHLKKDVVP